MDDIVDDDEEEEGPGRRVDQLRSKSSRQLARGRLVPPPLLNGDEEDGLTLKPDRPTMSCIPMTFMWKVPWGEVINLPCVGCSLIEGAPSSMNLFHEETIQYLSSLTME